MSESYVTWLTAAVVLSALALVAQAVCLFLMYQAFQRLQKRTMEAIPKAEALIPKVEALIPKAEAMIAKAEKAMADSSADVKQLTAKAHAVMDLAQGQLTKVDQFVSGTTTKLDEFVGETTGRARVQMDRVETLLDESIGRVRHTVGLLNDTVTRPVREVNAVSAGLKAAIGSFFHKRRPAYAETGEDADDNVGTPEAVSEMD